MNKVLIVLILAVAAIGGYLLLAGGGTTPDTGNNGNTPGGNGTTTTVASFQECVDAGYRVMESYPRRCQTPDGETFTEDIDNELTKEDLIRVNEPRRPGTLVESPVFVGGEARGSWYFEASFSARVVDSNGNTLGRGTMETPLNWMTEDFVAFRGYIPFDEPTTTTGTVVLEKANPSGMPENADELRIPVEFGDVPDETGSVTVHYGTSQGDDPQNCAATEATTHPVPATDGAVSVALSELMHGPYSAEKERGLFTSLNPGVGINDVTIENGTARIDFDEQLQKEVGGSCQTEAIRAQITNTVKEFDFVDDVVISVNGQTEGILQP